jgi:hypothetical protein
MPALSSRPRVPSGGPHTICIDCRYIRERPSGIGVWVQALVDQLPRLAPDLQFLFIKHPKGPARLSLAPNVRECTVRQEANGPATLFSLGLLVDFRGVDLYHNTFNLMPYCVPVPTVVSVTDIMQIKHPAWAKGPEWWGWLEVGFKWYGVRRALRHADLLIAVSEATRNEIASVDRAAAARTRVALQGVSREFRQLHGPEGERQIAEARSRLVRGAPRYVLAVGQFSVYKNHETILRAFARAFAGDEDMHMVFVQRLGRGPRVLQPIARTLGIEHRVHFVRNLSLTDLIALYNGASLLAHPSLYEGYGNAVIEAMACGCPVVTANRVSMPEVAGGAAVLVDPDRMEAVADALCRVATDRDLASSMRTKGLRRAAELTWEAFAQKHLQAYREALSLRSER